MVQKVPAKKPFDFLKLTTRYTTGLAGYTITNKANLIINSLFDQRFLYQFPQEMHKT